MKPRRRYLTFSLRTLFILLTTSAVWLGVVVNRAREQREAVEAIEALGGTVTYDFQITGVPCDGTPDPPHVVDRFFDPYAEPPGPLWLRRLIGDEFFQEVVAVMVLRDSHRLIESDIHKAIPYLKQLRGLKRVAYQVDLSDATLRELQAALPDSFVTSFSIQHTGIIRPGSPANEEGGRPTGKAFRRFSPSETGTLQQSHPQHLAGIRRVASVTARLWDLFQETFIACRSLIFSANSPQ